MRRSECPRRRESGLLVRHLDGETIVHDTGRDQISHLDVVASRVWALCDGERDLAALAIEAEVSEAELVDVLARLSEAGLLVAAGIDRRALLARVGAVAFAAPVLTVMAPSAVHAASPPPGVVVGPFTHTCRGAHTQSFRVTLTGLPPSSPIRLNSTWSNASNAILPPDPTVNVASSDAGGSATFNWTFVSVGKPISLRSVSLVSYQVGAGSPVPIEGTYTAFCP